MSGCLKCVLSLRWYEEHRGRRWEEERWTWLVDESRADGIEAQGNVILHHLN